MDTRFKEPYSNPRWWWEGEYLPLCFECVHFWGMIQSKPRCKAFPEGIPETILDNDIIHDSPYPGDHGIQYAPIDDKN